MAVFLLLAAGVIFCTADDTGAVATQRVSYATCDVKPSEGLEDGKPRVKGDVLFSQHYPNGKLEAIFYLDGFPIGDYESGRAIHIHRSRKIRNGCDSTGPHYNPLKVRHPNHPGDFGNFYPKDGKIRKYVSDLRATLIGPYSILGRSLVIHEEEDDMGRGDNSASLLNGNAGKRLACCLIRPSRWKQWGKNRKRVTGLIGKETMLNR